MIKTVREDGLWVTIDAMADWREFVEATRGRNPIPLLVKAVALLGDVRGEAVDLGCGAGTDAKYLAENGFQVTAVDISESAVKQTKVNCAGLSVVVIQTDIAKFSIAPDKYNLIMIWNTLPFLKKEDARQVLINIRHGLKSGGLLVFGVFGPEDDWAKDHSGMSFWTEAELKELLPGMEFVELVESKKEGPAAVGGNKFWHKIQGIVKKL